ncbi:riboflavin kinase-domain-containing protein [Cryomyces antarcticus]
MRPDGPRDPLVGPDSGPVPPFPLKLDGKVIKGFGRGSKELGIPTANIPIAGLSVGGHEDVQSGVYYGWAGLSPSAATTTSNKSPHADAGADEESAAANPAERDQTAGGETGAVYPMVMSIGWNPFYKNSVRSVEVHIMHDFPTDFYESHMNLIILGFIRPEYDYVSKESLIEDIMTDVEVARKSLQRPAYEKYRRDGYLLDFKNKSEVAS